SQNLPIDPFLFFPLRNILLPDFRNNSRKLKKPASSPAIRSTLLLFLRRLSAIPKSSISLNGRDIRDIPEPDEFLCIFPESDLHCPNFHRRCNPICRCELFHEEIPHKPLPDDRPAH